MRSPTRITLISVLVTLVICILLAAPIFAFLTQATQFSDRSSAKSRDPQRGSGGPGFSWSRFALTAIAPSVSSLSPSSAIAGGAGFSLTVNGTGFVNGFVIRVNGLDRTTAFVDSTQLSTAIDATEIAAAGSFSVTVFDPNLSGGESAPLTFTIANPVPIADSLSPPTMTAGAPAFTLTVNGSNFVSGATVHFGVTDHAGTVNVGATQVTETIDAAEILNASTVAVRVSNPGPGGGASTPDLNFTVNNPLPTISNLTPASANAGSGGFTLAIDGSNFVSGATVRFGA